MGDYSESWLKFEEYLGVRPVLNGTADEMRSMQEEMMTALAAQYPPIPNSIRIHEGVHDSFNYRIFCPAAATSDKLPVGVYYHPGGLVIGSSIADDYFCATVASSKIVVISIMYRLSPEHKAPAHLEDGLNGFEWAYNNASRFGGDSTRIYAIGVSAGAGLAFSVTRKVLLGQSSLRPDTVKGIAVFCPVALHPDHIPKYYKSTHTSYAEMEKNVPLLNASTMRLFFDLAGNDAENEDYFPIRDSKILGRLPPVYVCTSELDPVRDDGTVLVATLKDARIPVKSDHYLGLPHCFWIVPSLPETETFYKNAINGMQWVIGM
ncbi:alpha/beta-hydrolase [Trichoderma sp. SZMC 28015]